jgi:hypothetical protein
MEVAKIFTHNIATGEQILRDMTPEEIAELEAFEQSPIEQ